MRAKYPATVIGGLAASAPIGYYDKQAWPTHDVDEFTWSDIATRDYADADPKCLAAISATMAAIEQAPTPSLVKAFGVCDAAARCSWGLFLYSGRLRRACRAAHGKLDFDAEPLEGYPNGNYKSVTCGLKGAANGALIEVLVDHDDGRLGFRITPASERRSPGVGFVVANNVLESAPPYLKALPLGDKDRPPRAFPRGAALRPFASCYYQGDCIRFESRFVSNSLFDAGTGRYGTGAGAGTLPTVEQPGGDEFLS